MDGIPLSVGEAAIMRRDYGTRDAGGRYMVSVMVGGR